jgi:hypothetical protein
MTDSTIGSQPCSESDSIEFFNAFGTPNSPIGYLDLNISEWEGRITGLPAQVEWETGAFQIYPNPNQGLFSIKNHLSGSFKYEIFNATGELLMSSNEIFDALHIANAKYLAEGVHFLKILTDTNKIYHQTLIILK